MDPDVKAKWVEALWSGKYEQTTGVLASLDENGKVEGYCCLGVLCELAANEGVIEPGRAGDIYDHVSGDDHDSREPMTRLVYGDFNKDNSWPGYRSSTELPEAVQEWAKLRGPIPNIRVDRDEESIEHDRRDGIPEEDIELLTDYNLAELNDSGMSFDDIANLIEEQL